jgi:hypothetical protein
MNSTKMQELRESARRYTELDDRIDQMNANLYKMRQDRKFIENTIIDQLKTPEFSKVREFQYQGANFKVKEPGQWHNSWSLSQSQLENDLKEYFATPGEKNHTTANQFIVQSVRRRAAATTEWKFTRSVLKK